MPMNSAAINQGPFPKINIEKEVVNDDTVKYTMKSEKVDQSKYIQFVDAVTSAESSDFATLLKRLTELEVSDANVPKLLTASLGMSSEAGEFTEVVKKMVFQGKPYSEENVFHLKRELGDILWYIAQACMALDTNFDELMEMNVQKLKTRYPGGEFDVYYSENRKVGDL
jgi:NTP pyrophosphatase (non-canonical NTP hydrolase)